jgi:hypothetical protein
VIDDEARAKMEALAKQLFSVYQESRKRPSDALCDICGEGDKQGKNAMYKIRTAVHGYEHRPHASPHLCHRHGTGWALSFNKFDPLGKREDQAIDLHFATYIAKQLLKESTNARPSIRVEQDSQRLG